MTHSYTCPRGRLSGRPLRCCVRGNRVLPVAQIGTRAASPSELGRILYELGPGYPVTAKNQLHTTGGLENGRLQPPHPGLFWYLSFGPPCVCSAAFTFRCFWLPPSSMVGNCIRTQLVEWAQNPSHEGRQI
jgi:hypothetical protein